MSDSGRGVGLPSSAARRVTRSASREAAANQTPPRSSQRLRAAQQPPTATREEEAEEDDERKYDDEPAAAEGDDGEDPHLAGYAEVKSALLNEPKLSKAKRVYEYINRQHYSAIERERRDHEAAEAAEQAEQLDARQPKFYRLLFADPTNRATLYTLLAVSVVMLVAPVSTFYGVSWALQALGWQDKWRLSVSGVCAVAVVNVVSVGFGLYAYWEKEDDESEEEREGREGRARAVQDEWVRSVTKGQMTGVGQWNEELKQEREERQQGHKKRG